MKSSRSSCARHSHSISRPADTAHVKLACGTAARYPVYSTYKDMKLQFNCVRLKPKLGILALVALLGACASTTPDSGSPGLTCLIPSNCVISRQAGDLMPLRYAGTPAQAMELLRATVATFPEATVVRADPLGMELIFTTPIGFRDEVDFRIDAEAQLVHFRSRSQIGLFDFGKNRSRMREFTTRFEQLSRR